MQTRQLSILFALALLLAGPAQANDVLNVKQRLNKAQSGGDEGLVKTASEKIICKTDKKPICYAEAAFLDAGYALTKVTRPEEDKAFFILFQKQDGGSWKPLYSRSLDLLSWPKLKADRVTIPEPVAKRLIQKMQALR